MQFQFAKLELEALVIGAKDRHGISHSIVHPTAYFKSLDGQVMVKAMVKAMGRWGLRRWSDWCGATQPHDPFLYPPNPDPRPPNPHSPCTHTPAPLLPRPSCRRQVEAAAAGKPVLYFGDGTTAANAISER